MESMFIAPALGMYFGGRQSLLAGRFRLGSDTGLRVCGLQTDAGVDLAGRWTVGLGLFPL